MHWLPLPHPLISTRRHIQYNKGAASSRVWRSLFGPATDACFLPGHELHLECERTDMLRFGGRWPVRATPTAGVRDRHVEFRWEMQKKCLWTRSIHSGEGYYKTAKFGYEHWCLWKYPQAIFTTSLRPNLARPISNTPHNQNPLVTHI